MAKVGSGLSGAAAALLVSLLALPSAQAAIVTLTGSKFDVVYDDSMLGMFGTPSLSGDNLFFTPSSLDTLSQNGEGTKSNSTLASGIQLIAHAGYSFANFYAAASGDYVLQGSTASVAVGGSLTATDDANALTATTASINVDPSTLTDRSGAAQNWTGSGSITDATPTNAPGHNPWLANARTIDLKLWNQLSASTAVAPGAQSAYIQEKFAGFELFVDPIQINGTSPVPLPAALPLLISGIGLIGSCVRRRRRRWPRDRRSVLEMSRGNALSETGAH